jgi:hypothetical protein
MILMQTQMRTLDRRLQSVGSYAPDKISGRSRFFIPRAARKASSTAAPSCGGRGRGRGGWFGERHIDDLGKPFEKELEDFFVNYHELVGRTYRILAVKGPAPARRQVKACRMVARSSRAFVTRCSTRFLRALR